MMANEEAGKGVSNISILLDCCNKSHLEILFSYVLSNYILYFNRIFIFLSNTILTTIKKKNKKINKN